MTTAAFVFVVFQLNDSTSNVAAFKSLTNDSLQLPGAALMTTGLLLLACSHIHWVGFLGALEYYDQRDFDVSDPKAPRRSPPSNFSSITAVDPNSTDSSVVVMSPASQ